jgi:hypothetical protein
MTDVRASGLSTRDAQKAALLDAAQAALADANEKAALRRRRPTSAATRKVFAVVSVLLFSGGIYILAARPVWFFSPPPAPETVAIQEASLRLTLVRETERVKRYRSQHGRLPNSLDEAGSPAKGLTYQRQSDSTFRLIATFGTTTIGLTSTDSVGAFLGNSLKVIASRGRP